MQISDSAATALVRAVRVEGLSPTYHQEQMCRLKREWPTLFYAVMNVVAEVERGKQDEG